jgi:hypothetical protein
MHSSAKLWILLILGGLKDVVEDAFRVGSAASMERVRLLAYLVDVGASFPVPLV